MDSFKTNFTELFKSYKILLLVFFLISSFFWFNYDFSNEKGIVITSVSIGSLAEKNGFEIKSNEKLRNLEKIITLNKIEISTQKQFFQILNNITTNNFEILTSKKLYTITNYNWNSTTSKEELLGLSFRNKATSNLKLGIELEGGSKLILKPKKENLTKIEFETTIEILTQRLNKGGLSGTKVSKIEDAFSNERFILIESTSSNKNKIFDLLKQVGNFEAKLGNISVFTGENINNNGLGVNQFEGCDEQIVCTYSFIVSIDDNGTNQFYEAAKKNQIVNGALKDRIYFYLDGIEITNLSVSSVFKYQKIRTPQISITGDSHSQKNEANLLAIDEADKLKLILKTGPLPTELEVISSYTISSSLSEEFLNNSILIGVISLFLVSLIIAIRYQKPIIFFGVFIALISEIVIILGVSSLLSWLITIDLVAIGGLIAAIGTGVDDQIIINDEYFRKKNKQEKSKSKIKKAIVVVMLAYITTLAAMLPLSFAGLELIKGFSIMIILGITIGVFITRPAYDYFLRIVTTTKKERLEEDEE
jgi:preprotein translocase subunit SecD